MPSSDAINGWKSNQAGGRRRFWPQKRVARPSARHRVLVWAHAGAKHDPRQTRPPPFTLIDRFVQFVRPFVPFVCWLAMIFANGLESMAEPNAKRHFGRARTLAGNWAPSQTHTLELSSAANFQPAVQILATGERARASRAPKFNSARILSCYLLHRAELIFLADD